MDILLPSISLEVSNTFTLFVFVGEMLFFFKIIFYLKLIFWDYFNVLISKINFKN